MKKLEMLRVKLGEEKIDKRDVPKIRGYVAKTFEDVVELHNHKGNDGFIYKYPIVQYKTINDYPVLIGINEGCNTLTNIIFKLNEIDMGGRRIDTSNKGFNIEKRDFGVCDKLIKYEFKSPWLGLNQENHKKYLKMDVREKKDFLKRSIVNNIISLSKGLNYTVEEEILATCDLKEVNVNFKNKKMLGFKGSFKVNFKIPDFLGIGKSVSKGFGTVVENLKQ